MPADSKLSVETHTDSQAFLSLEGEWNRLLKRSRADTLFSTWQWQTIWWDCFGQDAQLSIVTVREAGELIGLAPFYALPSSESGRTMRLVGGVEVSDYLDIIVARGREDLAYAALWHCLTDDHSYPWEVLDLHNVPASSPTLTVLSGLARKTQGIEVSAEVEEVCPVINLPSTWERYLSLLNKKQRHEVRRKIRKAKREASARWYYAQDERSLHAEVEDFIRLHQKSDRGKMAFMDRRKQAFFHSIARAALEHGWLKLAFLVINEVKVAAAFCFDYDEVILVYNSGYDPQLYSSLSTGIVLLACCIRDAIEEGRKTFDFLRGEEEYKYRFGALRTEVHNLRISRRG
ncbi:MAG: hypothetical protein CEE40_00850 [Chloroflexi bacterium B3_Chlor]|nr:MAG: hypothetical protein CEE40_00850 [Chloroflexi bacterium B3_Chlor]